MSTGARAVLVTLAASVVLSVPACDRPDPISGDDATRPVQALTLET
jgi:hypothetical protein